MLNKPVLNTEYQVFNYVKNFLLDQNKKSIGLNGDCQYIGIDPEYMDEREKQIRKKILESLDDSVEDFTLEDNEIVSNNLDHEFSNAIMDRTEKDFFMRCAVGCLIDLNNYSFDLEGKTFDDHYVIDAVAASNPLLDIYANSLHSLLHCLQKIHDGMPVETWEKSFSQLEQHFCEERFTGNLNTFQEIYSEWQNEKKERLSQIVKS